MILLFTKQNFESNKKREILAIYKTMKKIERKKERKKIERTFWYIHVDKFLSSRNIEVSFSLNFLRDQFWLISWQRRSKLTCTDVQKDLVKDPFLLSIRLHHLFPSFSLVSILPPSFNSYLLNFSSSSFPIN